MIGTIAHNMPRRRRARSRAGFTLIEVVATIVILASVASVASNILLTAGDGYLDAATRAQLHSELSMALDRLVREVRQIDLDNDADDIAPDIDSTAANALAWHSDCSVSLDGSTLELVIDGGDAETLLTDVSGFTVQTYDEDNSALAASLSGDNCDPIRRVSVTITLSRYGVSETLRTKVFIRSCMVRGDKDPA